MVELGVGRNLTSGRASVLIACKDSEPREAMSTIPARKLAKRVDSSIISHQIISSNSGVLRQ